MFSVFVFVIVMFAILTAFYVERFIVIDALSQRSGKKEKLPFGKKERDKNLEEYRMICKENQGSLFWYRYQKFLGNNIHYFVYLFALAVVIDFIL